MRNSLNWGIYWCTNMSIIKYFVSNLKCNVFFKVKYSKIWYRQLLSSDLPFSNEENSDRETAKSWNWNTQYIYLYIYWETGMSLALIFFFCRNGKQMCLICCYILKTSYNYSLSAQNICLFISSHFRKICLIEWYFCTYWFPF